MAFMIVLGVATVMDAPAARAAALETPKQPTGTNLGAEGPCAVPTQQQIRDATPTSSPSPHVQVQFNLKPELIPQKVWIIRPTGTSSTPAPVRTDGRCDDKKRPVVLMIHGFPVQDVFAPLTARWNHPAEYFNTVRNFVSNGYIVVFTQYNWTAVLQLVPGRLWTDLEDVAATVTAGFIQVVKLGDSVANPTTGRMDPKHLGIWGHSLGGGVAPIVSRALAADQPGWGASSRWLALNAPADLFARCDDLDRFNPPEDYPFDECDPMEPLPANTRVLITTQNGDFPAVNLMGLRLFLDMPTPTSKWFVTIRNDCTHGAPNCTNNLPGAYAPNQDCLDSPPPEATDCMAGHLLPTITSDREQYQDIEPTNPPKRVENHLNYFGLYRNQQALSDCARNRSAGCNADLGHMGTWSDATPAERAEYLKIS